MFVSSSIFMERNGIKMYREVFVARFQEFSIHFSLHCITQKALEQTKNILIKLRLIYVHRF